MSFVILGIGTAAPEHSIEQSEAATVARAFCDPNPDHLRLLPVLYRRTGVHTRHSVVLQRSTNGESARQTFYAPATSSDDRGPSTAQRMSVYEEDAPPLASTAARAALRDAGLAPGQVTHLVTVSCSGFNAPGVDVSLIRRLGLAADVARTHIGFMGCHGALNGLRVAKAMAEADGDACVLVCAVELCSLHQQYGWHPDKIVANALFGDGAAALVGRAAGADDDQAWRVTASGCTLIPESESTMSWCIRDHGFEMTLSPRVPDVIRRHLRRWLAGWLARHDLSIDQIGAWAIHPGGPRILATCCEAAGFEPALLEPSREVLAQFGNMSSPTVLFILQRLRQHGAARPCVALGFGPGLTIEAALIR